MTSEMYVRFNNGEKMPIIGLGLWKGGDESDLEFAIDKALEAGYRHFDTAYFYDTEKVLGRSIQKWISSGKGKREDLFIVTKLPWNGMSGGKVEHFMNLSLAELNLSYVDLYLVHWPVGVKYVSDKEFVPTDTDGKVILEQVNLEEIWAEMENLVRTNKTKSIGVSNYNEKQMERILKVAKIPPVNNQVELHSYFQQKNMRDFCEKNNITLCAYSPLGGPWRKNFPGLNDNLNEAVNQLENKTVSKIGQKHGKSNGQILLRYLVEMGVAVIPKSSNAERLKENINIFDFKLDTEDLKALQNLDQGPSGRVNFPWKELVNHPECPFDETN